MSNESLPWDEEVLKLLEKIPAFIRGMAKKIIEKSAKAAGEDKVTGGFIDVNKAKLIG